MIYNVKKSCSRLELIIESIQKNVPLNENLRPVTRKIHAILNELIDLQPGSSWNLEKRQHTQTLETLGRLRQTIDQLPLEKGAQSRLIEKIVTLQSSIEASPFRVNQEPKKVKVDFPLAFFCDIDVADDNGAIAEDIKFAIQEGLPFVTTPQVLCGTDQKDSLDQLIEYEMLILENKDKWEIFKQMPEQGEGLLVFLPKKIYPDLTGKMLIKAFDLNENLVPLKAHEAFKRPVEKCSMENFINIFAKGIKNKVFYLSGHGNGEYVGGLNQSHYNDYLNLLDAQKCAMLTVKSCLSGGKSSLFNLAENKNGHSYLTIVQSIGDYPTVAGQEADQNISPFLSSMIHWLQNPKQKPTITELRTLVEKVEGNKSKKIVNFKQAYFPHSAGISGGFRTISEQGGRMFALTHIDVKRALLSGQLDEKVITIDGAEGLALHTTIVPISLQFQGKNPNLFSQLPGQGHHFIKEIHLINDSTALNYLQCVCWENQNLSIRDQKGYFIKKITNPSETKVIENVALCLSQDFSSALWQEGSQHYYMDSINWTPLEISPLAYDLVFHQCVEETSPDEKSIRATTAGNEDRKLLEATINEQFMSEEIYNELFGSKSNQGLLFTLEDENALCDACLKETSNEGRVELLSWLVNNDRHSLALKFMTKAQIDPNSKDLLGYTLLCSAIKNKAFALIDDLLSRCQVDADSLVEAVRKRILTTHLSNNKYLSEQDIKIAFKDKDATALGIVLDDLTQPLSEECFRFLTKLNPHLVNQISSKAPTFLGSYLNSEMAVDLLLEAGANPNLGTPSALSLAVHRGDTELIAKLLKANGNPFLKDSSGKIPLIEALLYAPVEVVKLLMDGRDPPDMMIDERRIGPVLASLFTGDEEKIKLVEGLEINNTHPTPGSMKLVDHIFNRLKCLNSLEEFNSKVKELVQTRPVFSLKAFQHAIAQFQIDGDVSLCEFILDKAPYNFEIFQALSEGTPENQEIRLKFAQRYLQRFPEEITPKFRDKAWQRTDRSSCNYSPFYRDLLNSLRQSTA